MLECRFESQLGLEFCGFSMWHFLKLVIRGFLRVLLFPPFLHRLTMSTKKVALKQMHGWEWKILVLLKNKKISSRGPCLYHACAKEDGALAGGSAVKCRKAIFAYVANRKSSSCTLHTCWNRVKKKKERNFDFVILVLRKFHKITAISHPCRCDFNSVKLNSLAVPSYHVAYSMMHMISARCVAGDLQTIAPGPLERVL